MNVNPGNGRQEFSVDWVKRQLEAISAVEPPQSLKAKLEAGIPAATAGEPAAPCILPWWRGIRRAGAVAAVVIVASTVAWLGSPWGTYVHSAIDTNGNSGRAYATDHNNLRPSDTNLCDMNSLR